MVRSHSPIHPLTSRYENENPFNFYLPLLKRQLTILGEV